MQKALTKLPQYGISLVFDYFLLLLCFIRASGFNNLEYFACLWNVLCMSCATYKNTPICQKDEMLMFKQCNQ